MVLYLGHTAVVKSRKEHKCDNVECVISTIIPGEYYVSQVTHWKNSKRFFKKSLHIFCLSDYVELQARKFIETEEERVITSPMKGLGFTTKLPEHIKLRRETLLSYLNYRDINSLEKAYKDKKTERVTIVMGNMAKRMAALELIDDEYNIKSPWRILDLYSYRPELFFTINRHDGKWWEQIANHMGDNPDRGTIIGLFLREGEGKPQPIWYE